MVAFGQEHEEHPLKNVSDVTLAQVAAFTSAYTKANRLSGYARLVSANPAPPTQLA